ncbi:MAG: universal stress protein [Proteobacteria bacterium]|nr:universal stress protein [Pseudomonadota bacterium]
MSLRTLLVPVTGREDHQAVVETALMLAKKFNSHLTALHVRPDPRSAIPFIGEGLTAEVVQDLCEAAEREGKTRAATAQAGFDALVAEYEIAAGDGTDAGGSASYEWEECIGFPADRLGRHARLADLTIVPKPAESRRSDSGEILHEVLYRSGRPLLMAPRKLPASVASNILVAWNGRAECARSIAAALPLMANAGNVTLLTVGKEREGRPSLDALKHYLDCHGIETKLLRADDGGRSISRVVLETAAREGADTLVMGAYSHHRWREMVLGGVTRHVIGQAEIPVFMSH